MWSPVKWIKSWGSEQRELLLLRQSQKIQTLRHSLLSFWDFWDKFIRLLDYQLDFIMYGLTTKLSGFVCLTYFACKYFHLHVGSYTCNLSAIFYDQLLIAHFFHLKTALAEQRDSCLMCRDSSCPLESWFSLYQRGSTMKVKCLATPLPTE